MYTTKDPIETDSKIWLRPLPVNRDPLSAGKVFAADRPVCHRDYFLCARKFLEDNRYDKLLRAIAAGFRCEIAAEDIDEVRICLVKHGAFYHPARVDVMLGEKVFSFVLNVAITASGKACMNTEYQVLKRLNRTFERSDLPAVYGCAKIVAETGGHEIGMFLAQWFGGFCEFHISRDPSDAKYKIRVWDAENGNVFLSREQARSLYRQAARILTRYYHFSSFEHIFSWHHAAGDFVLSRNNDQIEIKLISVRNYIPLFDDPEPDLSKMMHALLVFFLSLSIRMRLDRLDGTGPIVWADDVAVEGTLEGFLRGLDSNDSMPDLAEPFSKIFQRFTGDLSRTQLAGLLEHIAKTTPLQSPEAAVIQKHLESHAGKLYSCLKIL